MTGLKDFYKDYLFPFLRNFPWYLLLWPVFYAFNINAFYHGVIDAGSLWWQIFKWELLLVAFFFFFRIFFSNNMHAAILTVWLGFIFFYAHSLRTFFSKFPITRSLGYFPYLVTVWCLVAIILIILFIKSKSRPVRFSKFLMYLFVMLTFYEGISYIIKISKSGVAVFSKQYRPKIKIDTSTITDPATYPDIYYLIFDSYTNSGCLKRKFNYDNSVLDMALQKEGFYVPLASKSNYFDSPVSIAATFNMNYIPKADSATTETELTYFCGLRNLDNNNLWNFLEKKKYMIYNLSVFNIKKYKTKLKTLYFGNSDEDLLKQKTLQNVTLPPLRSFFNKRIPPPPPDFREASKENMLKDTLIIETELKKVLDKPHPNPVFFYSHCLIPHPPYVLDSLGKPREPVIFNGYSPDGYLQQCIFARGMILRYIQEIKQKAKGPFIIVIQGDHGYRYFRRDINPKECFNILNAWYFSDRNYSSLYNTVSSVNTYRIILNKYFKAGLPLLKDTSYFPLAYTPLF